MSFFFIVAAAAAAATVIVLCVQRRPRHKVPNYRGRERERELRGRQEGGTAARLCVCVCAVYEDFAAVCFVFFSFVFGEEESSSYKEEEVQEVG